MDPPSRQEIADTLHETIHTYIATNVHDEQTKKKYRNTAERIQKHLPNKNFSLTLLGNFQPDHEYFMKDYQKPKKYKEVAYVYEIDNSNGFFDNLPTCKPSIPKGTARLIKQTLLNCRDQVWGTFQKSYSLKM